MVTLVCTCHNSEMCKIVCNVLQPVLYLENRFLMTFVLINCSEWILGQMVFIMRVLISSKVFKEKQHSLFSAIRDFDGGSMLKQESIIFFK